MWHIEHGQRFLQCYWVTVWKSLIFTAVIRSNGGGGGGRGEHCLLASLYSLRKPRKSMKWINKLKVTRRAHSTSGKHQWRQFKQETITCTQHHKLSEPLGWYELTESPHSDHAFPFLSQQGDCFRVAQGDSGEILSVPPSSMGTRGIREWSTSVISGL